MYARDAERSALTARHNTILSDESKKSLQHQHHESAVSCSDSPSLSADNISESTSPQSSPSSSCQSSISVTSAESIAGSPNNAFCAKIGHGDCGAPEAKVDSEFGWQEAIKSGTISLWQENGELDPLGMVNWLLSRHSRNGTRWKQLAENQASIQKMRSEPFNFGRMYRRQKKEAAAEATRLRNKALYRPRGQAQDKRLKRTAVKSRSFAKESAATYWSDRERCSGDKSNPEREGRTTGSDFDGTSLIDGQHRLFTR